MPNESVSWDLREAAMILRYGVVAIRASSAVASGRNPRNAIPLAMATTTRPSTSKKPAAPAEAGSGLSRIKGPVAAEAVRARVRADIVLTFDDVLLSPRHSLV